MERAPIVSLSPSAAANLPHQFVGARARVAYEALATYNGSTYRGRPFCGRAVGDFAVALFAADSGLHQRRLRGSAKTGSQHWLAERISAVALIPLTLWFVVSVIAHTRSDCADFISWLRTPVATICMILLLLALVHHTALGLQVVIEDYVHSGARYAAVIEVRLGCYGLAVTGIIAVLCIAFGA